MILYEASLRRSINVSALPAQTEILHHAGLEPMTLNLSVQHSTN